MLIVIVKQFTNIDLFSQYSLSIKFAKINLIFVELIVEK